MLYISEQINQSLFVRRVLYPLLCLGVASTFLLGRACLADEDGRPPASSSVHSVVSNGVNETGENKENSNINFSNIYKNKTDTNGFSSTSYLEMMLALMLIVALIIGLAWGLRRINLPMMSAAGKMQIEGSLSLGHKEKLIIVNVGDKRLLLGATSSQITLIDRLSELNDADETKKNFSVKLKSIIKKGDE